MVFLHGKKSRPALPAKTVSHRAAPRRAAPSRAQPLRAAPLSGLCMSLPARAVLPARHPPDGVLRQSLGRRCWRSGPIAEDSGAQIAARWLIHYETVSSDAAHAIDSQRLRETRDSLSHAPWHVQTRSGETSDAEHRPLK